VNRTGRHAVRPVVDDEREKTSNFVTLSAICK
jgi:hypothetical protein